MSGEFTCLIPASFAKRRDLSIEARGLYLLLVALADGKTGAVAFRTKPNMPLIWHSPEKIQSLAACSTRTRLRMEQELRKAGLLQIDRERVARRGRANMYGKKRYTVHLAKTQSPEMSNQRIPNPLPEASGHCTFSGMEKRNLNSFIKHQSSQPVTLKESEVTTGFDVSFYEWVT